MVKSAPTKSLQWNKKKRVRKAQWEESTRLVHQCPFRRGVPNQVKSRVKLLGPEDNGMRALGFSPSVMLRIFINDYWLERGKGVKKSSKSKTEQKLGGYRKKGAWKNTSVSQWRLQK